ncbi:MAG: elongation factor 1-beta [Methanothrix sp.]|jgi:elongation factor 1-beta|uniref:Elongation factor 1-beta n=1 Tax=Methanothrix harundinacea TaxID=301375 RepID=A0A101IJB7_9EURY|nr:MAG: elongation factor 1-beta [Methanosaeta sp. SDB]KUK45050.1 MAG: Elongation factor 1-beta [Methanothrix harundinacea]MDD2637995.1 elongation factor 1-beta [Methanothrix sp.]MDI9399524.1 elongation factor 1-beta [Euryarchaeota archaeon]KUK96231.1 MAG: Elongation factor 1-beta [Methanothrix harundinacea]
MGEVAAKLKIMPEGADVDMEKLKEAIKSALPEGARLHGFAEEPIAFGLKALMLAVILAEGVTGTEGLEAAIASVEGVQSVEVEEVGLL